MRHTFTCCSALALLAAFSSCGIILRKQAIGDTDKMFVMEASEVAASEVRLGSLAQKRARLDETKELGQNLIKDHRRQLAELKALATEKGFYSPTSPNAVQAEMEQHLLSLPLERFDRELAITIAAEHERSLIKFQNAAKTASDHDVREFADTELPVLARHLELARKVERETRR